MSAKFEHMSSEEFTTFRQSIKMNDKQIANLLGVTYQAVQLWERGERAIPTTTTRVLRLFKKFPQLINEFNLNDQN